MKWITLALLVLSLAACTDVRKKGMEFCMREGGNIVLTQLPVFGVVVGCVFPEDWGKS